MSETIEEYLTKLAYHDKYKNDLSDNGCGLTAIENLFSFESGTQSYINKLLDRKLAELDDRIKVLERE